MVGQQMAAQDEVGIPPLRVFATINSVPERPSPPRSVRLRLLAADYWPLAVALALVLALVVSDLEPATNLFWRQHQAITSLVTGAALSLAVIFGLERVLSARSRGRWKPIGVRIVEALIFCVGTEELLYYSVLG